MKATASLVLAPLAAATAIKKYGTAIDSAAVPFVSNSTGASCGIGYTYCGYILKEQKNFDDATILTAYCAGGLCNSTNGTTDTDPFQALFVCLPEMAEPRKRVAIRDEPYTGPVKIEVLCACSGKAYGDGPNVCLNPDADHIGRCSSPCSN